MSPDPHGPAKVRRRGAADLFDASHPAAKTCDCAWLGRPGRMTPETAGQGRRRWSGHRGVDLRQFLERDRQAADAFAGGVEDGVADRRRDADHADLAYALAPQGRGLKIGNADGDRLD